MNATAVVQRMTVQDAQILAEYSDPKMTQRGVADKLGVDLTEVNQVVVDMALGNRDTAHTLVAAWRRTPKGKRWLAAQEKAAPKPEFVDPTPTRVDIPAAAEPEPEQVWAEVDEKTRTLTAVAEVCEDQAEKARAELGEESISATLRRLTDERDVAREGYDAVLAEMDELRSSRDGAREALRRLDQAAGRDIGKENEPLLDRIADLKRGREESTERVIELVKRVAELEAQLERAEQRMVVDEANTLVAAEHSGDATLKAAAFNVRTELRQLADRVEQWQRETPLREELAQIEARAAEIRAQLGASS